MSNLPDKEICMNDGKSLDASVLVIYHARCNDGFCAAWALSKVYPGAEFYPALHGTQPPDVTNRDVYILDFAYKREIILEMQKKARSLIVIDHHKTAADDLQGLDCVIFNMKRSGAYLAWHYATHFLRQGAMWLGWNNVDKHDKYTRYAVNNEVPWLVAYAEDRDLHKWNLPHSHEVAAAVSSYPMDFAIWDGLDRMISYDDLRSSRCEFVQEGAAIARYQCRQIDNIILHAREVCLDTHQVLAANTSIEFCDVAGKLARGRLFGMAWYLREDGKFVYSLRSEDNGIDVSEIASRHGGGGHRNSAGFESTELLLKDVLPGG